MVYQIDVKCDNRTVQTCVSHCAKHCYDSEGNVWPDHSIFHRYEFSDEAEEYG